MTKLLRLLLLTSTVAALALGGATRALAHFNEGPPPPSTALACGDSKSNSYAGPINAYGISAEIAQTNVAVLNGSLIGWVGVGGLGQGPYGSTEALQIGSADFPSIGSSIYYEVVRPGRTPMYHQLSTGLALGTYTKVTVLEMHNRPNWWRVWVNHEPASKPIFLPHSRDGLKSIAASRSWDGGTGVICNVSSVSFRHISIAGAPGGGWQRVTG